MALTRGPLFSRDTKRNCTTIRRQLEDTLNALPTKKQNVSLKREQIDHIKERIRDLEMRINIETGPEKNNLEREKNSQENLLRVQEQLLSQAERELRNAEDFINQLNNEFSNDLCEQFFPRPR